jgi:CTP:molybdopterin cytidylyltransferase MocA
LIAVAILAAGRSVRFGGDIPKPLLELGGRTVLARALHAARASGLRPLLCVVSDDRVAAVLSDDIETIRNAEPERGIASSLQVAISALVPRAEFDGVVIGLADQPLVGPAAYQRVAAAAAEPSVDLAVATYSGTRGNPVYVGRRMWSEALALTGDEGARVLIRRHGAAEVPCDGTGDPTDIDTPRDLAALEQTWRSQTASE